MPFKQIKCIDVDGVSKAVNLTEGTFQGMAYFCIDIFKDIKNKDGSFTEKSKEELEIELRIQLSNFWGIAGSLIDPSFDLIDPPTSGLIKDYWLVITPDVCDTPYVEINRPKDKDNFVVTPFYDSDIETTVKFVLDSNCFGFASHAEKPIDKSKQKATESRVSIYVAVQLNDEHEEYVNKWREFGRDSAEYANVMSWMSVVVGDYITRKLNSKVRSFIQWGRRKEYGLYQPIFMELYFNCHLPPSKKYKGYAIADGIIGRKLKGQKYQLYEKYEEWVDLFASPGVEFCRHGLSLEELNEQKDKYESDSWLDTKYQAQVDAS